MRGSGKQGAGAGKESQAVCLEPLCIPSSLPGEEYVGVRVQVLFPFSVAGHQNQM